MKTRERRAIFATLNIIILVSGLVAGGNMARHVTPHQKRTREDTRARIDQITTDEKVRKLLVADDEDIRALENLDAAFHTTYRWLGVAMSGLALGNLLLFPWKAKNL
ncbi:MAG TPA: hypothetical protein VGR14_04870 [Verrucomicrobiae bacterium]|jgi:hypothetical protein|nr:hypothetical protein [Verrucomicrobiae bacterium]